jgi:hypothetical protein
MGNLRDGVKRNRQENKQTWEKTGGKINKKGPKGREGKKIKTIKG